MTLPRPFLIWPDRRLSMAAEPVAGVDDQVREIWEEMLAAMYAMPGVGLAAPQIGVMRRLAVIDCSEARNEPVRLANPRILHESVKLRAHQEASPNLPGLSAEIARPRAVTVAYLDQDGQAVEKEFIGLAATSVQHQIDHLGGRMFFDHLSPMKRRMLLAKHAKAQKRRR